MSWIIKRSGAANRHLAALPSAVRRPVERRLRQLADDPYAYSKKLEGRKGERSSRVGDYRILFYLEEVAGERWVVVSGVYHRREAYR